MNHRGTAEERWQQIEAKNRCVDQCAIKSARTELYDDHTQKYYKDQVFNKNIENFVGTVKIPVGIAGPVNIKGSSADGSYYVPLGTTEAALVASISRGVKVINEAGGAKCVVIDQRVTRAPVFVFASVTDSVQFLDWVKKSTEKFLELAHSTSKHGKLIEIVPVVEANRVFLRCDYKTGNAAGQNMATFATKKIMDYIRENTPVPLTFCALEGGMSSDKKASAHILLNNRGRRVVAECTIPKDVVKRVLHTTPEDMVLHRRICASGTTAIGQTGSVMGNVANVVAGMYIACGQDPACVTEGHVGISRFDLTPSGDVYACITLTGLLVATVGGGVSLPSQKSCLSIVGAKSGDEFAEVVAAACLAGEISIVSAFSADEFAKAHFTLSRPTAKL
eukprot:TRINITY_DN6315_c0_g1_i1.p1 TRINITY_DN6315_c0_g1~~TRINITY_DN6315_c0_g1_i1.p1  ORF type:complete len:402 (-),score=118.35 TRINITY_DN6315_c0_g1_i1:50-1225(-)